MDGVLVLIFSLFAAVAVYVTYEVWTVAGVHSWALVGCAAVIVGICVASLLDYVLHHNRIQKGGRPPRASHERRIGR